jgi:homocitrate synthase NifV
MALKYVEGFEQLQFDTKRFRELGEYVAQAAGRTIPVWKSIIGTNMFAHESGIHADGVIKNPKTYEVFAPEEVGLSRQIVIGKHSGSKAILLKFDEYGITLTHDQAAELLPRVRTMSIELKRSLYDKELLYIYNDYQQDLKKAAGTGK